MNSTLPTETHLEQQLRRLLPAPTPGDHAPVDLIYLLAPSGHPATKQIPGHSVVDGAPEARG
ncbi:MAG TPA: hypothetical protein PKI09_16495 [Dermatophilaceae bacterium]|jgi:hypothetical protein|nr:hypothetical protein [Dermatophilaceae bacterium]HPZ67434.1 hypothetical protein [Dermatophilaceae bacterium]HQK32336.1 hypothetical protein [Phycicoccus sp.]